MSLAGKPLDRYLGSQHSAVGLALAWFGLPTLLMGVVFAITAAPEFPLWISISMAVWGLVALPLGISMRRRRPSAPWWMLANVLLAAAWLTLLSVLIFGR